MLDRLKVSRRFALRGALSGVGVAMWLPVLDVMCNDHGDAFAQGDELPTTFGIWFWGNGTTPPYWAPPGTDASTPATTSSGDAWQLPTNLEPFSALKDHLTFVTGLDMLDGVFKGHGWGSVYMLAGGDGQPATVASDINSHQGVEFEVAAATQYLPTIDQLVADQIGGDSLFASIETGVMEYRGLNMGTTSENLAHRGPNDVLPAERDPRRLFDTLFGTGVPSDAPGASAPSVLFSSEIRRSTLDAVLEDAASLRGTLGATDSARLERHMESVRELERRLDALDMPLDEAAQGGCRLPTQPAELDDPAARGQAIHRLLATALACNLTRVYTHMWSGARDDNRYPIATTDAEHHTLTHGTSGDIAAAADIERYIMEQYADLVLVLRDTPIGNTTALNQTLIYGATDVSDPGSHIMRDYHLVLTGHAGGKLPGNKHIRLPTRRVTELQLTMLQTMGLPIDNFGSWDNTSTTIPEIFGEVAG